MIQKKNGMRSGWETVSRCNDLEKAIQKCVQVMKQLHRKNGTEWLKTRVATEVNGQLLRVYPPLKSPRK